MVGILKIFRVLGLFCFLGGLQISCMSSSFSHWGIQIKPIKKTLLNGLMVILVEDHTTPSVSYQTWFRVGSVDEYLGITGMSHLFEHLMFKGTVKYGPKEFFNQLETQGAEVNALTSRDSTVFYQNFSADLLEKVIDMESDRLANIEFDDSSLNNGKMVVFEERRLKQEKAPEARMQEALWQLAYRRHPYEWPVIGYPADLVSINTTQLTNYFKTYYQPGNAAVIVVGNFNSNSVFTSIKKHYEKIEGRPRPQRKILPEPPQTEERRLVIRDRAVSQRFVQAYHISSADQDDSYALDVLANILFEGTTSRAYRRLVEEKDRVSLIAGSAYTPTYPGLFLISATMKGKNQAVDAEVELRKVIEKIQNSGVTVEEVQTAVRQLKVQVVDSIRTPYGLGQLIGTVQTIFGDPARFADDLVKYGQVRPTDVQRVAEKYLNPNNRSVVTLMPSP